MNAISTFGRAILACAALCFCSAAFADDAAKLRGGWVLEQYLDKDGTPIRAGGRLLLTESDVNLNFWVPNDKGEIGRSATLVGKYTIEGNKLAVLADFMTKYVEPAQTTEKDASKTATFSPPLPDPGFFSWKGDKLVLDFPSGRQMTFSRSK